MYGSIVILKYYFDTCMYLFCIHKISQNIAHGRYKGVLFILWPSVARQLPLSFRPTRQSSVFYVIFLFQLYRYKILLNASLNVSTFWYAIYLALFTWEFFIKGTMSNDSVQLLVVEPITCALFKTNNFNTGFFHFNS